MVGILLQVAGLSITLKAAEAESAGFSLPTGYIGYLVLALIVTPVVILVTSAVVGGPRDLKVPGLFLVCLGVLISATVVGFAVIGKLLGLVIPS